MNKKIIIFLLAGVFLIGGVSTIWLSQLNKSNTYAEKINQEDENSREVISVTISSDYAVIKPEDLYEYSDIVLIAEYTKDIETVLNNNGSPFTTSEFKINKILKNITGKNLENSIKVKYLGGKVSLNQLLAIKDNAFKEKLGINNMSKSKANNMDVNFSTENIGDKKLSEEKSRILFVNYNSSKNEFVIVADKYGMISYNNSLNTAFDLETKTSKKFSFLK